jgi:hypothetical protein
VDNVAYLTRTYSRLVEGIHKTFLGPHALGARSWPVAQQTRNPYHTIGTVLKQASSSGDGSEIHITMREESYLLTLT